MRYTTPYELSQPMEPHACLVVPRGEGLIVHVSTQIVDAARASIARTLLIDPERIHIVTPYVGGGFGSKLRVHAETILAALAARALRRPVKVALSRQQMLHLTGVRPTSSERVRLGAMGGWSRSRTRSRCTPTPTLTTSSRRLPPRAACTPRRTG